MSAAEPMTGATRLTAYEKQNGTFTGTHRLTAAQRRRFLKKMHASHLAFTDPKPAPRSKADDTRWRTQFGMGLLHGLGNTGKHVYGGTVSAAVKASRRAAAKRARRARRTS